MYRAAIVVLVTLILMAGVWTGYKMSGEQTQSPSQQRAQFLKGGDFVLNQPGASFALNSLRGRVVVLYFGYTHCPDVCPTGLAVMRDAFNNLDGDAADTQGVFVSIDPERDTAERLREYVGFFHERIMGVSGTHAELTELAKNYGIYYRKVSMEASALGYTVDHTANFFIVDADGQLAYVLDHAVSSKLLAETIQGMY